MFPSLIGRTTRRDQGKRRGLAFAAATTGAAALLVAGCSSSSPSASPAASSAGSSSAAAGSGGSASGATVVKAAETEFHIALSQKAFSPGTYKFVATDKGQLQHNLVINGPGVSQMKIPGLLSPGQSGSVTVTLAKGTYDIFCGVPGHKAQGMDVHITVG
ncbi:MAG: plastocyanin/azurin family copper-binding protein [Streptosporangiaceae bacterium]